MKNTDKQAKGEIPSLGGKYEHRPASFDRDAYAKQSVDEAARRRQEKHLQKRLSWSRKLSGFGVFLLILQGILSVVLFVFLLQLHLFSTAQLVVGAAILSALFFILFVLQFHQVGRFFSGFVSLLLVGLLSYGVYYSYETKNQMEAFTLSRVELNEQNAYLEPSAKGEALLGYLKESAVSFEKSSSIYSILVFLAEDWEKVTLDPASPCTHLLLTLHTDSRQLLLTYLPADLQLSIGENGQYTDTLSNHEKYGAEVLMASVSQVMNMPISHYIRTNLKGLMDMVDYVGGIRIYNDLDYTSPEGRHFPQGEMKIYGYDALQYIAPSSDEPLLERANRHMALTAGLFQKMADPWILFQYASLAERLQEDYITDLPSERAESLFRYVFQHENNWRVFTQCVYGYENEEYSYRLDSRITMLVPEEGNLIKCRERISRILQGLPLD